MKKPSLRRRLHLSSFLGDKSEKVFDRIYSADTRVTIGLTIKSLKTKELTNIPDIDSKLEGIFYNNITHDICDGWGDNYHDIRDYGEGNYVKRILFETADLRNFKYSGTQFCIKLHEIMIKLSDIISTVKEIKLAGFIKIYDRVNKDKFTLFVTSYNHRYDYDKDLFHFYTSDNEMQYSNSSEYILDISKILQEKAPNH